MIPFARKKIEDVIKEQSLRIIGSDNTRGIVEDFVFQYLKNVLEQLVDEALGVKRSYNGSMYLPQDDSFFSPIKEEAGKAAKMLIPKVVEGEVHFSKTELAELKKRYRSVFYSRLDKELQILAEDYAKRRAKEIFEEYLSGENEDES